MGTCTFYIQPVVCGTLECTIISTNNTIYQRLPHRHHHHHHEHVVSSSYVCIIVAFSLCIYRKAKRGNQVWVKLHTSVHKYVHILLSSSSLSFWSSLLLYTKPLHCTTNLNHYSYTFGYASHISTFVGKFEEEKLRVVFFFFVGGGTAYASALLAFFFSNYLRSFFLNLKMFPNIQNSCVT